LCRLIDSRVEAGRLHLTLGPTDYRDMLGTEECLPEIVARFGHECLANALAACCVLVSRDGDIVLGRRSRNIAAGGYLHVCAGHVEPRGHENGDGVPWPFNSVRVEAHEELGLSAERLLSLTCNGLARIRPTLKAELGFSAEVALSTGGLAALFLAGGDDREHDEAIVVANSGEELLGFLSARQREITSAGQSSLTLHGAVLFGDGWLSEAVEVLSTTEDRDRTWPNGR
jgi:8-oxo-dGTP pyrophosphatase MutT (NUDIX family)